eukprot:TRINITY_DN28426_c0_g1_i1.p2 TRINITY_DN28426_c0_g1~~TRINITY_DN28426_c0_g1_i1.p2  ORF type:complete len:190 (-),score=32.63 TRINITY_DN28426_c0_g1_i1:188-757(-)
MIMQRKIQMPQCILFFSTESEAAYSTSTQKSKVKVPKFRSKFTISMEGENDSKPTRRKPGEQILEEIKQENEKSWLNWPRQSPNKLIDDAEKERFARLMEFNGEIPKVSEQQTVVKKPIKNSVGELEDMYDKIALEIEERQRFLKTMEDFGCKQNYEHQIKVEIRDRFKELKRVDQLIRENNQNQQNNQ